MSYFYCSYKFFLVIISGNAGCIGNILNEITAQHGIQHNFIDYIKIVGNTPMLCLLSQKSYELLMHTEYWVKPLTCEAVDSKNWRQKWNLSNNVIIDLMQPIAGFVGSDLLAGLVSVNIKKNDHPCIFVDFGTNSEIALYDGEVIWITSAAGGPAFEGCGISCGIPAETGAICSIEKVNGQLEFKTIGGGIPSGICGSGLIDAVAYLLQDNVITETGKFINDKQNGLFYLSKENNIYLTKSDIDLLQRAKAAIGAGMEILLQKTAFSLSDIQKVFVSGAFGNYLNISNAQKIGLLPGISQDNIIVCSNTALAGCEALLTYNDANQIVADIKESLQLVNLSHYNDFNDMYFKHLYLKRF